MTFIVVILETLKWSARVGGEFQTMNETIQPGEPERWIGWKEKEIHGISRLMPDWPNREHEAAWVLWSSSLDTPQRTTGLHHRVQSDLERWNQKKKNRSTAKIGQVCLSISDATLLNFAHSDTSPNNIYW